MEFEGSDAEYLLYEEHLTNNVAFGQPSHLPLFMASYPAIVRIAPATAAQQSTITCSSKWRRRKSVGRVFGIGLAIKSRSTAVATDPIVPALTAAEWKCYCHPPPSAL
jgi:hypothetical protein